MNGKTGKNSLQTPDLTPREQEIFNMLLDGATLKEISYNIKIKYDTAYFHQKNLFRKLNVADNNELLVKYLRDQANHNIDDINKKETAVFTRWFAFSDNFGSKIDCTVKDQKIKGRYFACCNVLGTLSSNKNAFAGIAAIPDSSTLESMKTASSFSFLVLGDGNTYSVLLPTADAKKYGEDNFYQKQFTTTKGKTVHYIFNVSELAQSELYGKPVPFIQNNIETFQLQPYSSGNFNLKIWDIKFYQ